MQEILLASPRKAKEVAAVRAILRLKSHECLAALAKESEPQGAFRAIEAEARINAARLGIEIDGDGFAFAGFAYSGMDDIALYDAVKTLSDHQLDALHTLLTALSFGQEDCDRLDTEDSLFNRVARDLGVDMKTTGSRTPHSLSGGRATSFWRSRRNATRRASTASGCCARSKNRNWPDRCCGISALRGRKRPSAALQAARDCLPDAMRFPAIDPDARQQEPDEDA